LAETKLHNTMRNHDAAHYLEPAEHIGDSAAGQISTTITSHVEGERAGIIRQVSDEGLRQIISMSKNGDRVEVVRAQEQYSRA